jgi:hypothetical protein
MQGWHRSRRGPSFLAALFPDTVQAVKAIRRIQRLVIGYSSASKKGYLEGCFIVTPANESNPELEMSLLQRLPTRNGVYNPIFFAGALYLLAKSIPGFCFLPATDEWMAPDSVFQLMPPTHMDGYAEEPLQPPPPMVRQSQVEPVVVPVKRIVPTPNKVTPKPPAPDAFVSPSAPVEKKAVATSPIEKSSRRAFPLVWVAAGCVALVVLGGIVFEVSHSHKSPAVEKSIAGPAQSPRSPSISPVVAPATIPLPEVPQQTKSTGVSKPTVDSAKNADRNNRSDKKVDTPPTPKEFGGDRTGGVRFTTTDVPALLARATRFSGDGNFEEAIREYNIVLGIEPNNAQAREGLNRARLNQSHH